MRLIFEALDRTSIDDIWNFEKTKNESKYFLSPAPMRSLTFQHVWLHTESERYSFQ